MIVNDNLSCLPLHVDSKEAHLHHKPLYSQAPMSENHTGFGAVITQQQLASFHQIPV